MIVAAWTEDGQQRQDWMNTMCRVGGYCVAVVALVKRKVFLYGKLILL